jgi:hypothetical protein
MKILLFFGEQTEEANVLKEKLKSMGYQCPTIYVADEIDQAGKQYEKAVVIFSGTKIPFKFLKENTWPFHMLNILYVKAKPKLTSEIEEQLREVNLSLYYPGTLPEMINAIDTFLERNHLGDEESLIETLEFNVLQKN